MSRNFPDFVEAMEEAAEGQGIPAAYVRWGAIWAIGAAMGRHVYTVNQRGKVYPNLYVLMVGPPGTGKSQVEDLIRPFFQDLEVQLAAQHVSKAALIDELEAGHVRKVLSQTEMADYHHTAIISSEFVETFPEYNLHFLGMLARWWDCPSVIRENKRHLKSPIEIHNVCCNMITGVQPGVLASSFPSEAWTGGFLARTIFVYEPKKLGMMLRTRKGRNDLIHGNKISAKTKKALVQDLEAVSHMTGQMQEDEDFVDAYLDWKDGNEEPRPMHPKLQWYNDRREHQLEKLSMISAASRGSMTRLGLDYKRARQWLEGTESNIEEIFVEMAQGDDMELMNDMHSFIMSRAGGVEKPLREEVVRRYLTSRIPTQRQESFIDVAEQAGFIKIHHKAAGRRQISAKILDEWSQQ